MSYTTILKGIAQANKVKIAELTKSMIQKAPIPVRYKKFLQAHHIRRWSSASILRYDPNNGITLCKNCHKKVTGNEQYYESLFMEIVRKKNGQTITALYYY